MIINEVLRTPSPRVARWNRIAPTMAAVDRAVDRRASWVTVLATVGRMRLPFFIEAGDVDNLVAVVGVPIVIGWLVFIALHGAYVPHVMGAGTTEYKLVVRATMVAAGAPGSSATSPSSSSPAASSSSSSSGPRRCSSAGSSCAGSCTAASPRHLVHRVVVAGLRRPGRRGGPGPGPRALAGLPRHRCGAAGGGGRRVRPAGVPVLGSTARTAAYRRGLRLRHRALRRRSGDLGAADAPGRLGAGPRPRCRSCSCPASPTSRATGCGCVPRRASSSWSWRTARAERRPVSKRAFDLVGAGALLVLASPLLLATAIAIKLHDGGPVLFRQQRVGTQRRPLRLLQVPLDGHRRRAHARHGGVREQARGGPRAVQGRARPAGHPAGSPHPALLPRRDAPVPQRPAGRDEPGRPRPPLPARSSATPTTCAAVSRCAPG